MKTLDHVLDDIYDEVDTMLRAGHFAELDRWLPFIVNRTIHIDIMLAWLTATLPAASKLLARTVLFARVKAELKQRGEDHNALLAGLKGGYDLDEILTPHLGHPEGAWNSYVPSSYNALCHPPCPRHRPN